MKEIMSGDNTGPEFLKQRYPGLSNSPEVTQAAKRTATRTNAEVSTHPGARIHNYLDRFREIIERKDPGQRAQGITALKRILVSRYVVRVEDIPDSYWQAQMRVVRERGESGDWQTLPEEEQLELKRKHLAQTKEDQQGSLEEWIDYFASDKSSYLPDHLKYWAFRGMLRLERYEKGNEEKGIKGRFPERPTGRQRSIKMFPEVNERALKFISESYEAQAKNQTISFRYDISQSAQTEFLEHLKKKDFRSLYGWGQEHIPPISEEEMRTTEGEWLTYDQHSAPKTLTVALQGKGSGWCIAGENLAEEYLNGGNLHVYYTRDREGKFTIPRVVIVQKGDQVTEVRGIEREENVDNYIQETNIIGDKLKEIPGGEAFFDTDEDTKRLTAIDKKMTSGGLLTGIELAFLYEVDRPIKYFGIEKDPRIAELRAQRNQEEDMSVLFGCSKDQIARTPDEVNDNTKAYVGSLVHYDDNGEIIPIFEMIEHLEHIYAAFPEGRVKRETISIGGKTSTELQGELRERQIDISAYAADMIKSKDFVTLKEPENINLIRLRVQDMGLERMSTIYEISDQAKKLGLNQCPAEVGPHYCLANTNQPMNEGDIGMKPIANRDGDLRVFKLYRDEDGQALLDRAAGPTRGWGQIEKFVFSLGPPVSEASKVT